MLRSLARSIPNGAVLARHARPAAFIQAKNFSVKVDGDKAQVEIAPILAYKTDGPSSLWVDTTVLLPPSPPPDETHTDAIRPHPDLRAEG